MLSVEISTLKNVWLLGKCRLIGHLFCDLICRGIHEVNNKQIFMIVVFFGYRAASIRDYLKMLIFCLVELC